jgi:hypothetical protein
MKSMTNAFVATPDEEPPQPVGNAQLTPEQLGLTLESIERLALGLRVAVEYTSFSYDTGFPGLDYHVGKREVHRCNYAITLPGDQSMGQLEVTRHWPFRESELEILECCVADFCLGLNMLASLHPPAAAAAGADSTL